jgi:hypothetical protein
VKARLAILMLVSAVAAVAIASVSSAGTHAARRACTVNDERMTWFPADGAAGRLFEKFRIKHKGNGSNCTVRGFPKVTLLNKRGHEMDIRVHRDHSRKARRRVLKRHRPLWFVLSHPTMDASTGKPCRRKVYAFKVLLKGQVKSFIIDDFAPVRFCDKGARVTPVTSKRPG